MVYELRGAFSLNNILDREPLQHLSDTASSDLILRRNFLIWFQTGFLSEFEIYFLGSMLFNSLK